MHPVTAEKLRRAIGARLARKRRQLGLSQQDVADALGVGHSQVSRLEVGAAAITVERAHDLAEALDLRVGDIISLKGVQS